VHANECVCACVRICVSGREWRSSGGNAHAPSSCSASRALHALRNESRSPRTPGSRGGTRTPPLTPSPGPTRWRFGSVIVATAGAGETTFHCLRPYWIAVKARSADVAARLLFTAYAHIGLQSKPGARMWWRGMARQTSVGLH